MGAHQVLGRTLSTTIVDHMYARSMFVPALFSLYTFHVCTWILNQVSEGRIVCLFVCLFVCLLFVILFCFGFVCLFVFWFLFVSLFFGQREVPSIDDYNRFVLLSYAYFLYHSQTKLCRSTQKDPYEVLKVTLEILSNTCLVEHRSLSTWRSGTSANFLQRLVFGYWSVVII